MSAWLVFTRAEAPKFSKLVNWLFGLPVRGIHVGGGLHVDMPDTLSSPPPLSAPGWTTRCRLWVSKPANTGASTDEFAVRLTQEIRDAWQAKRSQLTAAQRNWAQSHIDVATDIELVAERDQRDVEDPAGGTVKAVVESDDVEPEA